METTKLDLAEFQRLRSLILAEFPSARFLYIARVAPRQKPNAPRGENNRGVAKVQVHARQSGVGEPDDPRQLVLPVVMAETVKSAIGR